MPQRCQLLPQLDEVVNLAVEDDRVSIVPGPHGLPAGVGRVDDRQPQVDEPDSGGRQGGGVFGNAELPARHVRREAACVRPAVAHAFSHGPQLVRTDNCPVPSDDSADAAHQGKVIKNTDDSAPSGLCRDLGSLIFGDMNGIRSAIVTGGSGAIGSRLVRRLLDDGAERVYVVDDLSSGYEWLLPNDERLRFIRADVCDLQAALPSVSESDVVVFHLAAFFANQNSVDHPLDDLHTNGRGTLTALLWAAQHARRLVYASAGCSIAGHGIDAPIQEDMPVSLDLDTPYQITKALGEFYCNYFADQVSTVRCRFFNSYGPGEVPGPYRNVIPNFIWRAMHGEPLVITGTGEETRDFIYVDDLVDGLCRAATVDAAHKGAFNLGTGVQTRVIDLAEAIVRLTASRSAIEFAPRRAWDHSVRRQADVSRAGSTLGFRPVVQLVEGLARTVQWFAESHDRIDASLSVSA